VTQHDFDAGHEAELDSLMAEINRTVNGEPVEPEPEETSTPTTDDPSPQTTDESEAAQAPEASAPVFADAEPEGPVDTTAMWQPDPNEPVTFAIPAGAAVPEVATGSTWEPEPEQKPRKKWPTLVLALLVLLAGAYIAGAVAFMQCFMPKTSLNGTDVSLKTISDVAKLNADSANEFSFAVTGDGVDLNISAADIKAAYDGESFARSAIAQQKPWLWPFEILSEHKLEIENKLSYDAARLEDIVGSAVDATNKDATEPKDASVAYNKDSKRYEVVPEVLGSSVKKAEAIAQVRDALNAGETSTELGDDLLEKPKILSTDEKLTGAVNKANSYLDATQELVYKDEVVASVDEERLQEWVSMSDDLEVSFDKEACTKWARGELSEKLDSYGSTRTYTRPDGPTIEVSGGTYGWIIDGGQVAEDIAKNVEAGTAGKVELSFKQEAERWNPGGQDWGDKFMDVDLSEQHVRYFVDGEYIWESDCVSGGLDNKGEMHSTPTGVYAINSNKRSGNVKLTGKTDPVTLEPEYISYVDWWMPFIDDSVAFHDADWRSSFGGEIYLSNGSHGCVNLPVDKAAELYGILEVGTPVVVHD
jgi:hypothetical protein